uniref:Uncharacterized protein n=1 Tax=Anguilla anguilla TaxID=7936 RepID=A0A0E9VDT7_ANGAN
MTGSEPHTQLSMAGYGDVAVYTALLGYLSTQTPHPSGRGWVELQSFINPH